MSQRIDSMPIMAEFLFNNRIFVILRREGNMSEVRDEFGKKWAWPNCAKAIAIEAVKYQYHGG